MDKLIMFLEGKKTEIQVVLIIIIEVLAAFDILDRPVANSLEVFLGAGAIAALGARVRRASKV
jgi:lipoate-protein ligase B